MDCEYIVFHKSNLLVTVVSH